MHGPAAPTRHRSPRDRHIPTSRASGRHADDPRPSPRPVRAPRAGAAAGRPARARRRAAGVEQGHRRAGSPGGDAGGLHGGSAQCGAGVRPEHPHLHRHGRYRGLDGGYDDARRGPPVRPRPALGRYRLAGDVHAPTQGRAGTVRPRPGSSRVALGRRVPRLLGRVPSDAHALRPGTLDADAPGRVRPQDRGPHRDRSGHGPGRLGRGLSRGTRGPATVRDRAHRIRMVGAGPAAGGRFRRGAHGRRLGGWRDLDRGLGEPARCPEPVRSAPRQGRLAGPPAAAPAGLRRRPDLGRGRARGRGLGGRLPHRGWTLRAHRRTLGKSSLALGALPGGRLPHHDAARGIARRAAATHRRRDPLGCRHGRLAGPRGPLRGRCLDDRGRS